MTVVLPTSVGGQLFRHKLAKGFFSICVRETAGFDRDGFFSV